MLEKLIQLDKELFLFLNGFHSETSDFIWWWISSKTLWIPLYVIILYFVIKKFQWRSISMILIIILGIAIADQISSSIIKELVHRLRPSHNPDFTQLVHIVNDYRGGLFGFVSSHAANTFLFATLTSLFFRNKWFSFSIFTWAIIVSYSRIALAVHYPLDIIGGAILGISISIILYLLYKIIKNRIKTKYI
ncbi:MAG: hypothetical protein A2033_02020 [Bacteroidetes bacterium GWA2_31_9]|nr:MAG: hypothetical protein A2033_02020 [Bacteroidetes bacterium GWA2_31_9]